MDIAEFLTLDTVLELKELVDAYLLDEFILKRLAEALGKDHYNS